MIARAAESLAWEVRCQRLRLIREPPPSEAPGVAVVLVAYTGVCGSDIARRSSGGQWQAPDGWRPGHEVVGRRVSDPVGQFVAVNPLVSCWTCRSCRDGDIHLCENLRRVGAELPGGLAEFVAVPETNLVTLPPCADPAAAVLADVTAVALHGLRCGLATAPRGRLGVIGDGPLAIATTALSPTLGWPEVVIVANDPDRRRAIAALAGADVVATSAASDLRCSAVIDAASGRTDAALRLALEAVVTGGTVLVQNAYAPNVQLGVPLRNIFRQSITVRGSFSFCRARNDDFADAVATVTRLPKWVQALTTTRWDIRSLPCALRSLDGPYEHRPSKIILQGRAVDDK